MGRDVGFWTFLGTSPAVTARLITDGPANAGPFPF
jgi:hypothetical protein